MEIMNFENKKQNEKVDLLAGNGGYVKIKNVFTVNIMGSPYKIKVLEDRNEFLNFYGKTCFKEKEILLAQNKDLEEFKKTLFHELIHAYLGECGLAQYYNDEILVSWLENTYFKLITSLNNVLYNIFKK